jgi:hypothetical protein
VTFAGVCEEVLRYKLVHKEENNEKKADRVCHTTRRLSGRIRMPHLLSSAHRIQIFAVDGADIVITHGIHAPVAVIRSMLA